MTENDDKHARRHRDGKQGIELAAPCSTRMITMRE
jgi:hypothetical protein